MPKRVLGTRSVSPPPACVRSGEDEGGERRERRIKKAFKATGSLAHDTYMPNACAIFTSIFISASPYAWSRSLDGILRVNSESCVQHQLGDKS